MENPIELTIAEAGVIRLGRQNAERWRSYEEGYWLARLMEEVGELASATVGSHERPIEWELQQIAAICTNWLDMRLKKYKAESLNE